MARDNELPKFPKFMGHLESRGMNIKILTEVLNNKGHEYKYNTVRRKLRGDSDLNYDDIIIFADVLGVEESIFFGD